jgi:hypothetical protein
MVMVGLAPEGGDCGTAAAGSVTGRGAVPLADRSRHPVRPAASSTAAAASTHPTPRGAG